MVAYVRLTPAPLPRERGWGEADLQRGVGVRLTYEKGPGDEADEQKRTKFDNYILDFKDSFMSDLSHYESRTGSLSCTTGEVFDFVTDLRNFEQFIPPNTINNWQSEKDNCSFGVSMIGTVSVRITKSEPYDKVIFSGDALKKNDFSLILNIYNNLAGTADVNVLLEAELNPMLKIVANKPIVQFLEMLIREMESFRDWKNTIK